MTAHTLYERQKANLLADVNRFKNARAEQLARDPSHVVALTMIEADLRKATQAWLDHTMSERIHLKAA